ncbi:unnamed protein product [Phaedon cochleariae]|uniref:Fibrinogen C-terminal domain-containing protein n=1 Tax=Phaedon cochleariae TaxID=80249 RepID=A0A9P0GV93_PHACE|nr:unnamed protein product [Phaedon cochleariae]
MFMHQSIYSLFFLQSCFCVLSSSENRGWLPAEIDPFSQDTSQSPSSNSYDNQRTNYFWNQLQGDGIHKMKRSLDEPLKKELAEIKEQYMAVKEFLENYNFELLFDKYLEGALNNKPMSSRISEAGYHHCGDQERAVCRTLVGVDKLPICKILEKNEAQENFSSTPRSCKDIQRSGQTVSGLYEIQPKMSQKPFTVLCDMQTKGGGWTHIHKRVDGSEDFYRGWREYKHGFGNLEGEFWIGLQKMHELTSGSEVAELLVEIVDRDNKTAYARYNSFKVGPETAGYPIEKVSGYSGDAGDALTYHLESKFTTMDYDQDEDPNNCAKYWSGAWWHKKCFKSSLNGKFVNVDLSSANKYHGLHWESFKGLEYCHAKARMMLRPIN